jgi:hypothetical protein
MPDLPRRVVGREALAHEPAVLLIGLAQPAAAQDDLHPRAGDGLVAAGFIGVPVADPEIEPPILGACALRRDRRPGGRLGAEAAKKKDGEPWREHPKRGLHSTLRVSHSGKPI